MGVALFLMAHAFHRHVAVQTCFGLPALSADAPGSHEPVVDISTLLDPSTSTILVSPIEVILPLTQPEFGYHYVPC